MSFDEALDNLPSDDHLRLDSRHEIQAPLRWGQLDLVPYLVGRLTAYDDDLAEFAGNDEPVRLWGSSGLRLHTQFSRTFDQVDLEALDVHRLRHIVEPMVDLSVAAVNLDSEDLPVYDDDVESIRQGSTTRLGLRQTLQTQRGGPDQWRTVDWIVLQSDLVLTSDDTDVQTPIGFFPGYRPELAAGGDHFNNEVMWMISDTLAAAGEVTYNMEIDRSVQWRVGATLDHSPALSSFVDFSEIDPVDSSLLSHGFVYQLTRKYRTAFVHRLDFTSGGTRRIQVQLERKLPRWRLMVVASHDEIEDAQSIGLVVIPDGVRSSRLMTVYDTTGPR